MLEKHTFDVTGHVDNRCLHRVKAAREEATQGIRMSLVKQLSTLIPTVTRDRHTEVDRWDASECETNLENVQYRVKSIKIIFAFPFLTVQTSLEVSKG